MKLSNEDGHAHLKYLENGQYEEAIKLLNSNYEKENKEFLSKLNRSRTINIEDIKQPSSFEPNTKQTLNVRSSFWFWLILSIIITSISIPFLISYNENGQASMLLMPILFIGLAIPGFYYAIDRRVKMSFNPISLSTSWGKNSTIDWVNILTAYDYTDYGKNTVSILIIYKKNTLKPERWRISRLQLTSEEIGYAFNRYFKTTNKKTCPSRVDAPPE